jgi:hypothetical protein
LPTLGVPLMQASWKMCVIVWTVITASASDAAGSEINPKLKLVGARGEQAPGMPVGIKFDQLIGNPALNNSGRVAFHALVAGDGIGFDNRGGVWSESAGALTLIARTGNHAPDVPSGVHFAGFPGPVLTDAEGRVALRGTLSGNGVDSTNDTGIWAERNGTLTMIARGGEPAKGLPLGISFGDVSELRLNNVGQTAFMAGLQGSGVDESNDFSIWSEGSGMLRLVARKGDEAPGAPLGARFRGFGTGTGDFFAFNSEGASAFFARLEGTGIDETNSTGVWAERNGVLSLIARAGASAAGAVGAVFHQFGDPAIDSDAQTAFAALLTGHGVDATNNSGIWSEGHGALQLVARAGDAVPGMPEGARFGGFFISSPSNLLHPVMNSSGQTAFLGTLVGPEINEGNDTGVWVEHSGSLSLVAREGDRAPGTPEGVVFSGFDLPVLNSAGQVAIRAFLTGDDLDQFNDIGIWAQDRSGQLRLVARNGEDIEVRPGDFRGAGSTSISGTSFNDSGQLAFYSSGIGGVVSNVATIPEPGTIWLLAAWPIVAITAHRQLNTIMVP